MPKKLIEVAIPLTQISEATAQEKRTTARLAHPANIHLWWARRPLAASRAVLFAQLVDDPSSHPERFSSEEKIVVERERLFDIMRALVAPEGPSESVLQAAQREIEASVGESVTLVDPFAGGGSIPIEALRLGLTVSASDLNPVAVLLNQVLLKQVKSALDKPPVRIDDTQLATGSDWRGLTGLGEDLLWYGSRLRELVTGAVGRQYPEIIDETGVSRSVIAWIWARTTPCPNPAWGVAAPLVRSFVVSKKPGREKWIDPVSSGPGCEVSFVVRDGKTPRVSGTVGRSGAHCVACNSAIPLAKIREDGRQGLMGQRLMTVVALGDRRRLFFPPTEDQALAADVAFLDPFGTELVHNPRDIKVRNYGILTHAALFTSRQLRTLTAFGDLLEVVRNDVLKDSAGDREYSDLVATLLAICISKLTDTNNSLVTWLVKDEVPAHLFARQAIPMVWDFVESNPIGQSSGSFLTTVQGLVRNLLGPLAQASRFGNAEVVQGNATTREYPPNTVVCTDPAYIDNIGYAGPSAFSYVWMRYCLNGIHRLVF